MVDLVGRSVRLTISRVHLLMDGLSPVALKRKACSSRERDGCLSGVTDERGMLSSSVEKRDRVHDL